MYAVNNTAGIRNADGIALPGRPAAAANQLTNADHAHAQSHAAPPLIKQPYTDQANLGFSKVLGHGFAIEVDGVYAKGADLGVRPALNRRINGASRAASPASCPARRHGRLARGRAGRLQPLQGHQLRREEALGRQAAVQLAELLAVRLQDQRQPARHRTSSASTTPISQFDAFGVREPHARTRLPPPRDR